MFSFVSLTIEIAELSPSTQTYAQFHYNLNQLNRLNYWYLPIICVNLSSYVLHTTEQNWYSLLWLFLHCEGYQNSFMPSRVRYNRRVSSSHLRLTIASSLTQSTHFFLQKCVRVVAFSGPFAFSFFAEFPFKKRKNICLAKVKGKVHRITIRKFVYCSQGGKGLPPEDERKEGEGKWN